MQPVQHDAASVASAIPTSAETSSPARVLVAGIGNIFLGDDAFGVEVAQQLLRRTWPQGVRVVDFGIRGIDLTYALLEGWDAAILIDAAPRALSPGTVYTVEPDPGGSSADASTPLGMPLIEAHSLDPARVLRLVAAMGGRVGRMILVACEPVPIDPEADIQPELSPPVRAAVDQAVALVERLTDQILHDKPIIPRPEGAADDWKELHHGTFT